MKRTLIILTTICFLTIACTRNTDGDSHTDVKYFTTRYIGKEICYQNDEENYHLLEIVSPLIVGDSIVYQGSGYGHVVKAKGINSEFQRAGTLIGIDAKVSDARISSTSCNVDTANTYTIYELKIIDQIPFR